MPDVKKYKTIDLDCCQKISDYPVFKIVGNIIYTVKDYKLGISLLDGKKIQANVVFEPQYSDIEEFNNGIAIAYRDNRYACLIDLNGNELISLPLLGAKIKYDENAQLYRYSNNQETCMGLIDQSGKKINDNLYHSISSFYGNVAIVSINRYYGVINKQGDTKIDIRYARIDYCDNGVFIARSNNYTLFNSSGEKIVEQKKIKYLGDGYFKVEDENKAQGIIDSTGKIILPYSSKYKIYDYLSKDRLVVLSGKKFKITNMNGKTISTLPKRYPRVAFQEIIQSNWLEFRDYKVENGFWSRNLLMDFNGKIIFPSGMWHYHFIKGCDKYLIIDGSTQGLINKSGEFILNADYSCINYICNDTFVFKNGTFEQLFNADTKHSSDLYVDIVYHENINLFVANKTANSDYCILDEFGHIVLDYQPYNIKQIYQDILVIQNNDKEGLMTFNNEIKGELQYDHIEPFINDYALAHSNNKTILINKEGVEMVTTNYQEASLIIKDNLILVADNNSQSKCLLKTNGQIIFEDALINDIHILNENTIIFDKYIVDINDLKISYNTDIVEDNKKVSKQFKSELSREKYLQKIDLNVLKYLKSWVNNYNQLFDSFKNSYYEQLKQLELLIDMVDDNEELKSIINHLQMDCYTSLSELKDKTETDTNKMLDISNKKIRKEISKKR